MPHYNDYNEDQISKIPALEVLQALGYTYLTPAQADAQRGGAHRVLLNDILQQQLARLNRCDYKGATYPFSPKNLAQAAQDLDASLHEGLVKANETIFDRLTLGESYAEMLPDGANRAFTMRYIDWNRLENNVFHVSDEFSVENAEGQNTARPDIVVFVNGIPFGVIECKKASISMKQGISQMIRNQGKTYIPQLFKFAQILLATNKNEAKYATCGTDEKFWAVWKEQDVAWHDAQLQQAVPHRLATAQDRALISLFHPRRLLELSRFFTLYDHNVKKIARYQQYFAVKKIFAEINTVDSSGNRPSGVVWHTQGSGKSLTMVMFARRLFAEFAELQPKVVIVTDRKNLDKQIHATFHHARLRASRAASGRHLADLIGSNSADIVTTLVHKFDKATEVIPQPVVSRDVFVLVDESHRTHYGELHIKMKQVFPNACYIGFTGTPLMRDEKNTLTKFGKLFHQYTIADGVADKAIVPLLYEGKMVEQSVNKDAIDQWLDMITKTLNPKQKAEVKQKWSRFEKIASTEQRIRRIAFDIATHFGENYKSDDCRFKAMLATNSKSEAIKYLDAFEDIGELRAAVVISAPDQREGFEAVDQPSKDRVNRFWARMMAQYGTEDAYEDALKDDFIEGNELEMLIVVDKLLTGFDAPRATVLYIDKPMKEHTLLQAIARVNRLYEGKDYGRIIDYRGLLQNLDQALQMYTGAGLDQFDPNDLKDVLFDVISIIGTLRHYYSELQDLFAAVENRKDREEYEVLLADEEKRADFYDALCQFGKHLALALESEEVYNALRDGEVEQYKREYRLYQELRAAVKLRYSDGIDHKEYEAKMQKLMDNYISADGMMQITLPVDILDEQGFEAELRRLGTPRAQADATRSRLTKDIESKWDENPAYYKAFSQRIEETLDAYKNQRISEAEYFAEMQRIRQDYARGEAGHAHDFPESIRQNGDARAFYGQLKLLLADFPEFPPIDDHSFAEISLKLDNIFREHIKVDWHHNRGVHNKITQALDDLLYDDLFRTHQIAPNTTLIDKIIESLLMIAQSRY